MKYLIVSGNPKKDGLCASICEAVMQGAKDGGAETELLTIEKLERCHACGDGWGACRERHACTFGADGFTEAQGKMIEAAQFCFITPVYFHEMAEPLKCFFDRLRRCEAVFLAGGGRRPALEGKPVLLVASPGGSGNGAVSCLDQMNRFCGHTGAVVFDYISINRWNNDYKKKAAYSAARAMAEGRKAGETLV